MAKVKICGVTDPEDARYAAAAGAWAVGVNLWPRSKRFVSVERGRDIAMALSGAAPLVGVFVNADRAAIERAVAAVPLDMIQLHGDEKPADCEGWAIPVIKAVRLRDRAAWDDAATFATSFILIDAYVDGEAGGTGRRIETSRIGPGLRDRLILAGGLDADNVVEAIRAVGPFAVDVASGVESAPGRKDREKMKRFIDNALTA